MAGSYKRVYLGVATGIFTLLGLFAILSSFGLEIQDKSGDIFCAGTIEDPCVSYFDVWNPTARSIYIYNYDEVYLDFSPNIKGYELYVKYYGKWVPMNFTMETRLGNIPKDRKYVFVFPRYSRKEFKLVGYKNNPFDVIKWGVGAPEEYLDPWWFGGCSYKVNITLDKPNTTLNNFQIPINGTGGIDTRSGGDYAYDEIAFSNLAGTQLNWDIENPNTSYSTVWVEVDTIDSASNTTIEFYYGCTGISNTYNNTWTGYGLVSHLENSTYQNIMTGTNPATESVNLDSGVFGNGTNVTVSDNDNIAWSGDRAFGTGRTTGTMSLWIKMPSEISDTWGYLAGGETAGGGVSTGSMEFMHYPSDAGGSQNEIYAFIEDSNADEDNIGSPPLAIGIWNYHTLIWNATGWFYYINGTEIGTDTYTGTMGGADIDWGLGSNGNSDPAANFMYDEFRLKNESLSKSAIVWNYDFGTGITHMSFSGSEAEPINTSANITLYLDGINSSRKYEYGTYANLSAYTDNEDVKICMDIIAQNYGIKYQCSNDQVNVSYLVGNLIQDKFSTGSDSVELQIDNGYDHTDITIEENITLSSFKFNITGINDSGYPKNTICDIGNDTTEDISFPGTTIGNTIHQDEFSDNLTNGTLLFSSAGSKTIYMKLSSTDIGNIIAGNGSMNITSNQANSEPYDYTQYYWNSTELDSINSTVSNQWVWDNFTIGDISGRWSGSYTVTSGDKFTVASSAGCTGTGSCGSVVTNNDDDEAESLTLDITEYGSVFIRISLSSSYQNVFSGCPSWNTGSSTSTLFLKDKNTGSTTTIAEYSSGDSDTSTYEIRKVGSYIKFYDDGLYLDQFSYDSSHQYELKFTTSASCSAEGDGSSGGVGSAVVYIINATGLTGVQSEIGDMKWDNSTIISKELFNFTDNLVSAKLTATDLKPTGTKINYYLSADNGTNWEEVTSGVLHEFINTGKDLRYKAEVNCTGEVDTAGDLSEMAIVKDLQIEVSSGSLENITVDVGQDGTIDWIYNGSLANGNSTQVNWSSTTIDNYISLNCNNLISCLVPLTITSQTSAAATYFLLDQNKTIYNYELSNLSIVNEVLKTKDNFTIQCWEDDDTKLGRLNFSLLEAGYTNDGDITVIAYSEGDYTYNDTYVLQVRISNYTLDYPNGVYYWELIPLNKQYHNVTPYGQVISTYLNNSIPIFNLTNHSKESLDMYVYINDTHDCINITLSSNITKNDGLILSNFTAGTWYQLGDNVTNIPTFMWGDFYNCSLATLYYLIPEIVFEPICSECVYPGDLNG